MAQPYEAEIDAAARRYNVDPRLIRSIMLQESGGRATDRSGRPTTSSVGALGLMQLMPDTARSLGVDPTVPAQAIDGAARYLARSLDKYERSGHADPARMAVTEYFAGPDQALWGPKTSQYVVDVGRRYHALTGAARPAAPGQQPAPEPWASDVAAQANEPDLPDLPIPGAAPAGGVVSSAQAAPAPRGAPASDVPVVTPGQAAAVPTGNGTEPDLPDLPLPADSVTPNLPTGEVAADRQSPLQNAGAGLVRGVRDVVDAPAAYLADTAARLRQNSLMSPAFRNRFHLNGNPLAPQLGVPLPSGGEVRTQNAADRADYDRNYGNSAAAFLGRVGGQIAASAPVLGTAGNALLGGMRSIGLGGLADALAAPATVANPLLRAGARATTGAGAGAGGTALTADPDQPLAPQVATGAALGGTLGAAAPLVGGAVRNALVGRATPEEARLAGALANQGVQVRGTQFPSMGRFANTLDSELQAIPLSGQSGAASRQYQQIHDAYLAHLGEAPGTPINRGTLAAAERRIGGVMDDVANNTNFRGDAQTSAEFTRILNDARNGHVPAQEVQRIERAVAAMNDTLTNAQRGGIHPGQIYQNLTNNTSVVQALRASPDPQISRIGNRLRESLDDALERQSPPGQADRVREARRQWYVAQELGDVVDKGGTGENVTPLRLAREFQRTRVPALQDLVDGTRLFLREPPNSTTATRQAVRYALNPATALASGYGTMQIMGPGAAAAIAGTNLAGTVAGRIAGQVSRSAALRNALLDNPTAPAGLLGRSLSPVAVAPLAGRDYLYPDQGAR